MSSKQPKVYRYRKFFAAVARGRDWKISIHNHPEEARKRLRTGFKGVTGWIKMIAWAPDCIGFRVEWDTYPVWLNPPQREALARDVLDVHDFRLATGIILDEVEETRKPTWQNPFDGHSMMGGQND